MPAQPPLERALHRGQITAIQFRAGCFFRSTITKARLEAAAPPVVDRVPGPLPADHQALDMVRAREDLRVVLELLGVRMSAFLLRVVRDGDPLSAIEHEEGWRDGAGKVVLELVLERLAEHYKIVPPAGTENPTR